MNTESQPSVEQQASALLASTASTLFFFGVIAQFVISEQVGLSMMGIGASLLLYVFAERWLKRGIFRIVAMVIIGVVIALSIVYMFHLMTFAMNQMAGMISAGRRS